MGRPTGCNFIANAARRHGGPLETRGTHRPDHPAMDPGSRHNPLGTPCASDSRWCITCSLKDMNRTRRRRPLRGRCGTSLLPRSPIRITAAPPRPRVPEVREAPSPSGGARSGGGTCRFQQEDRPLRNALAHSPRTQVIVRKSGPLFRPLKSVRTLATYAPR